MIVVIADDFTGAAEIAGISLRYDLTVELVLGDKYKGNTDVLVVCTDSRSFPIAKAMEITASTLRNIDNLKPGFIYKKIDSILRGHVLDEIKVQQAFTAFENVFIMPANPSLGRTIKDGEYFIKGQRITDTSFAADPEFPVQSSFVREILGETDIQVLPPDGELPAAGVVIGESGSMNDVRAWVNKIDETWMLVGAGDFYSAILEKKYSASGDKPMRLLFPHLYVCGTAYQQSKDFVKLLDETAGCVLYLPEFVDEKWFAGAARIVREQQRIVIAIDRPGENAVMLRSQMATAVKRIIAQEKISEIFIEGGSTAAAVLQELDLSQFTPVNELQRGVVRMYAGDFFVTVKPGSYQLPKEIAAIYADSGSGSDNPI